MGERASKIGHVLAKGLGIKVAYRDPLGASADPVTRGESTFSVGTAETYSYNEPEPTSIDWIREVTPSSHQAINYLIRLFPFLQWIGRYNLQWFIGDLVAGITVGAVVVPQGMAYAKLAELSVEFGLYSSFMGVLIYWFFATSKDITIGVSLNGIAVGNTKPLVGEFLLTQRDINIACGRHVYTDRYNRAPGQGKIPGHG